jgi:hypothetical protein
MNSAVEQIKKSYEVLKMTPDEIANDQDLEVSVVKAALSQFSSQYRKDCGQEIVPVGESPALNFSDDQLQDVNKVIYEIAIGAEDDHTRLKAAMYIRDDKMGRLEKPKQLQGNTFNLLTINEAITSAREGAARIKSGFIQGQKAISV